jgi:hypothetical protein
VVAALEALAGLVATCLGNQVAGPLLGSAPAARQGHGGGASTAQQALQQLQQLSLSASSAATEPSAAAAPPAEQQPEPGASPEAQEGLPSSDPRSLRVDITTE